MKILIAATLLAASLVLGSTPGAARDRFNVAEMRCSEAVALAQDDVDAFAVIVIWIDGYLGGVTGDTHFDVNFLETFTERLITRCSQSPKRKVLEVARAVGIQN